MKRLLPLIFLVSGCLLDPWSVPGPDAGAPCLPDPCNGHGACTAGVCTQCAIGYAGSTCNQCAPNYSGYPTCAAGPWVESWKQTGETATSHLGLDAVSFGPDTNGDGIGDVLVGAQATNNYEGAAYLYSGKDGSLLRSWAGTGGSGNFGMAVSLGPDVNGDGRGDVLIAAPTKPMGAQSQVGEVDLYDGVTGQLLHSWTGTLASGLFGYSVSLGPDVNGDGRGDVLIGMIGTSSAPGNAYLYSGADGTLLRSFMGNENDARFGAAVVLGPDVSGDARGDILIAENRATVGTNAAAGKVYLYSGASGVLLKTFSGQAPGERFGVSIALGPDVDGDGKPDVAIGTSVAPNGVANNAGKASLFSSATGNLIRTWKGPYDGARLGIGLSLGPDADGDGRGDLLVGSETAGYAALFSSASGQMLNLWTGATGSGLGQALALAPDQNGDGKPEVIIASPTENAAEGAVRLHVSNRGTCAPSCAGKCGGASDGCGGTCTAVSTGFICSEQFLIPDPCAVDPCNGHGTCSLGACTCSAEFAGSTCNQCAAGYASYLACTPLCSQPGSPTDITPGLNSVFPAVAWNGTGWGAVYRDARGGPPLKIFFSRLDSSGAAIAGNEVQVASSADSPDIAYASGYGRYGVVWAGTQVWFACVDANGTLHPAQQITTAGQLGSTRPRITSTGADFGVVWNDASSGTHRVYMAVLSGNSCTQVGSTSLISSGYGIDPAVAYASGEYGVVWQGVSGNNVVMFARANASGAKIGGSEGVLVDAGGGGVPRPRLAWSSARSEYGVVYAGNSTTQTETRFGRVSSTGALLGSAVSIGGGQFTAMDPNIAAAGSNYGITWLASGAGVRFLRTDSTGATLSPLMTLAANGYAPSIGWDGAGFLAAFQNNDVYTARVTCP